VAQLQQTAGILVLGRITPDQIKRNFATQRRLSIGSCKRPAYALIAKAENRC
jgi:hypothetical protein